MVDPDPFPAAEAESERQSETAPQPAAPHANAAAAEPPRLVYGIIALCVVVELLIVAGDFGLFNVPRLRNSIYEYAGFWPGLLMGWAENYPGQRFAMFLTYGFLHGGLIHLGMNMYTLWVLSGTIAERAGTRGFAQIYLGSMLGGAIGYALLSPSPVPMVGASGALFGLAGAVTAWVMRDLRGRELWRTLAQLSAYLIGINLVMYWALDGNLAWQTHLGGFVVGLALGLALESGGRGSHKDSAQ